MAQTSILNIVVERDKSKVANNIAEGFANGYVESQVELKLAEGKSRSFHFIGRTFERDNQIHLLGTGIDITELKQNEQRLMESEAQFRNTFEYAPVGVVNVALDGHFLAVNQTYCDFTGYSREELLSMAVMDLTQPEDQESNARLMQQLLAGEIKSFRLEKQYLRKDHSLIWGSLSVQLRYHVDGTPDYFIATIEDISQRKQVETQLQESEERLNLSQEYSGIGSWEADLLTNRQIWSRAVYQIMKLPDLPSPRWEDFLAIVHPDDRQKILAANQAHLTHNEKYDVEYRTVPVDGEIRWMRSTGRALFAEDGTPIKFIGIVQDITEHKLTEEMLRFHSNILQNVAEGVLLVRADDGVIVFTNPQFDRLFGYQAGELLGQHISIVNAPTDKTPQIVADEIIAELQRSEKWAGEVHNIKKDGTTFWCRASVASFEHPQFGRVWVSVHEDITERKAMENELRLSEQKFRLLIEQIPLALGLASNTGELIYINDRFKRTFGYTLDDVPSVEQWYLKAYPDENYRQQAIALWTTAIERALTNNTDIEPAEYNVTCKTGEVRIMAISGFFFENSLLAMFVDVTERKRMENELRKSEQRLNEAERIAQLGNWELDLLDNTLDWSDGIFRIFEIDKNKFVATYDAFLMVIHPEDRDAVNAAYIRSLETRKPYDVTHRLLMSDGRIKYVCERCETYYDAKGEPIRSLGTVQDITERKQVEERLRELNRDFVTFLENTSDFIYFKDQNSRIRFCSQTLASITQHESWRDLVGKHDLEIFPKEIAQIYYEEELAVFEHGQALINKIDPYFDKDGAKGWVSTSKWPVFDFDSHTVIGLFGISRDITQLKQTEQELLRSNADLEQFAYSVSHDMRQPLRSVSSHLQLLARSLKDKLDEDERINLNFALEGSKRMDAMILSLLEYSRVGRKTETKAWMNSRVALDEALEFLSPAIDEAKVEVKITGEWGQVFASHDELTRLFMNLVGNAIKYRDASQPAWVEVDSVVSDKTWKVRVRDYGIGIDPTQIERLFKFFSRLQARTRFEGNGMGLALCRRIVEHHGGKIWVESAGEGQGCCFIFELPLFAKEADNDQHQICR